MPYAPAKPCRSPRCAALAQPGSKWCTAHQPAARAEVVDARQAQDRERGSAHSRGYDAKWAVVSRRQRALFPVSLGYLVATPQWSPRLALQFHGLREAAREAGHYLEFIRSAGAWALSPQLSALSPAPIYTWHPSAAPEPSEVTDHIVPHHGDPTLFWAEWNLQPLSKRQHDTKTATEDGGFRGGRAHPAPIFRSA